VPEVGRLLLIDLSDGNTLAADLVVHGLRRAENVVPHEFSVTSEDREKMTGTRGQVLWLTGWSGSGKSTIANELSKELAEKGVPHVVLDGDSLRKGLNRDLGFSVADRVENIRRTGEDARLFADSGMIALVSLVSPFREDWERAAEIIGHDRFAEVFVDVPLEVCEERDPKGLYKKARKGLIPNFTGISATYESPENPAVHLRNVQQPEEAAELILATAVLSPPRQ
jgi:bifunctional enzyme CysN/CysC